MSRFPRLGLALILLLSAITLPVNAQGDTVLAVDPAQASVEVNGQCEIHLFVTGADNLNAFDVQVEYDGNLLTLVKWEFGDLLSKLAVVKRDDLPGSFRLVATQLATPGVNGDGVLLKLTFSGKLIGSSDITITKAEFARSEGGLSLPELQHGSISIIPAQPTAVPTRTPTATATLAPTATATQQPPTATRTSTRTATGTQIPPTPTPTRTATLVSTLTSGNTAVPGPLTTQPPNSTQVVATQTPSGSSTELVNEGVLPTTQVDQSIATQPVGNTAHRTDPVFIPVRPDSDRVGKIDETDSSPNSSLLIGFIIFDIIALAIILFLWMRRQNKRKEENE